MQVREIMTADPACCAPEATLREVAAQMAQNDCGEIPVVDELRRPLGVVTDRDIACRGIARGLSAEAPIQEVMSRPVVTVTPETDIRDCCSRMAEGQIRRMPVVDETGACCGMVAQADIADSGPEDGVARLVRNVSQPTPEPSQVS